MTMGNGIGAGQPGGRNPLELEAVDWVVRLTVGQLSDADKQAFERWLGASAAHAHAFAAASDLCGDMRHVALQIAPEDVEALAPAPETASVLPFRKSAHPQTRQPARGFDRRAFLGGGGALAAALAGGLVLTNPPLELWPSLAELMADERTAPGERRSFSPMAGVNVELNSRSSAYRTARGNGLDLVGGEAFVSVDGDGRPFRVTAGGGTVSARQASFNVQSYDGDFCVTCVSGSVAVAHGDRRQTLEAGREVRFTAAGEMRQAEADEMVRLAWRRGLLVLRRTPVSEAIPQINRYFPGRLVLADSSKSDWPVTGVFHIDQIELAVVQLQRLLDVGARRLPGGVVVLS
ncbi:DUF4880 domain-containing protein [Sandaracinobacter sp. RS1-74]|uniref:FecR family protein n=1 Tax=Sandaracinobacteroides sayramensis TaxID=2913411 RepID=UPI001EDB7802|nr:FecR domain-containing protein [Sandaracinobacteroides sayramensis]MCG2840443.1 DUF4880 domain-containing protein [Sandaracinobacteroides sayramensis]